MCSKNNFIPFLAYLVLISLCSFTEMVLGAESNFNILFSQGQDYLHQGRYFQASKAFEQSRKTADNSDQRALATGSLGLTHYQLQHDQEAERLLHDAVAFNAGNHHERARWLSALGTLLLSQDKTEEAGNAFRRALEFAGQDITLRSGIELQQFELTPYLERFPKLIDLHARLKSAKPSEERSSYLARLALLAKQQGKEGKMLAYDSLQAARIQASLRQIGEILGEIAQLYEDDKRYDEANQLNQQAISSLKDEEAPELLISLEWRKARLSKYRNQISEAIAAYLRATELIENTRHDIPLKYRDGSSSYKTLLEPIYQQLAELLLAQSSQPGEGEKIPKLRQIRSLMEVKKQSELEDFLGGRCAIQPLRSALLESVEAKTAIIYPIILPERLELLVSVGDEIRQFTQPVSAKTLEREIYGYLGALRNNQVEINNQSVQLYQWLITPLQSFFNSQQIQTLVIVPDGALRLLPFAALHDGSNYLIERYAISTSPGISIIQPSPIQPKQVKSLIVGLSAPGNVIDHLPRALIIGHLEYNNETVTSSKNNRSRAISIRGLNSTPIPGVSPEISLNLQDENLRKQIIAAFSLPGVEAEINQLKDSLPGTVLLNNAFTVEGFKQELLNDHYAVVHIASHLIPGSDAASSFIMAHDNILNFDQIDELLRSSKFQKQPVEMLTLSACQTAEGDDRAPLGLSGLAIKAKVRSALGTLWPVNDRAAPKLMLEFYKTLGQSGISKAKALRQAQIKLLEDKKLRHPSYWAPYILVGNWL